MYSQASPRLIAYLERGSTTHLNTMMQGLQQLLGIKMVTKKIITNMITMTTMDMGIIIINIIMDEVETKETSPSMITHMIIQMITWKKSTILLKIIIKRKTVMKTYTTNST